MITVEQYLSEAPRRHQSFTWREARPLRRHGSGARGRTQREIEESEEFAAITGWRSLLAPQARIPAPSFNRAGLESLTWDAQKACTEAGWTMPHNLYRHGPAVGYSSTAARIPLEGIDADTMVGPYARLAGFLNALAKMPRTGELGRLWEKLVSANGVRSPYTRLDLWKAADIHQHPYRLQRRLQKVRWRANRILRPYGLRVGASALGDALTRPFTGAGKLAIIAANLTCRDQLNYHIGLVGRTITRPFAGAAGRYEYLIAARGIRHIIGLTEEERRAAHQYTDTLPYDSPQPSCIVAAATARIINAAAGE
ncbi:MAG TPA: hypothetical protein VGS58_22530 [Candidatus Sulfopaludibacter sp.]|nr:hypothetical protein [Candidatus Sulfopaludibacter sp.]